MSYDLSMESNDTSTNYMNYSNFYHHYVQQPYSPLVTKHQLEETIYQTVIAKQEKDREFIENFIENCDELNESTKTVIDKKSNIAVTKDALINIVKLNNQLKSTIANLRNEKNLSQTDWQAEINNCKALQGKILEIINKIKNEEFLISVKKNLEKRKQKRCQIKKKKANWITQKLTEKEKLSKLNAEADLWIRKAQTTIEREKQEEYLRKDADIILSNVKNKRNDVKRFIMLLQQLRNLRATKITIAEARGEHISSTAADKMFNDTIDKLIEQWTMFDKKYETEEQGLKLMLKRDNEKRIETENQNMFIDWEITLFGKKISDESFIDLTNFIIMRTAWDKFISYECGASSIPIGWIVPDTPSSAAWQKFLKTE